MDLRSFGNALRRVAAMRGLEEGLVHWMVSWPDKLDVERHTIQRLPSGSSIGSGAHELQVKREAPRPPTPAARTLKSQAAPADKAEARRSGRSRSLPGVGGARFQAFADSIIHRKLPDAWGASSKEGSPEEAPAKANPPRARSSTDLRRVQPSASSHTATAEASEQGHGTKWFRFPASGKTGDTALNNARHGRRNSGTSSVPSNGRAHLHSLFHGQDKPTLRVM
mmetsp:Transcript_79635/g.200335  ORF Transcript_79635/g.200335 Transcript_79635/m.200335 type:complete len:224 (+) Transcript_79635:1-672(+)